LHFACICKCLYGLIYGCMYGCKENFFKLTCFISIRLNRCLVVFFAYSWFATYCFCNLLFLILNSKWIISWNNLKNKNFASQAEFEEYSGLFFKATHTVTSKRSSKQNEDLATSQLLPYRDIIYTCVNFGSYQAKVVDGSRPNTHTGHIDCGQGEFELPAGYNEIRAILSLLSRGVTTRPSFDWTRSACTWTINRPRSDPRPGSARPLSTWFHIFYQ
jgi:hypothetical protein